MEHELDPRAPLAHPDGTAYSAEERYAFFENVKQTFMQAHREKRAMHFMQSLPIADQLDLLWHELNDTGVIAKDGPWYTAVKTAKDSFPKDDSAYQKAVLDVIELRNKGN